jgi:hypothetical protein
MEERKSTQLLILATKLHKGTRRENNQKLLPGTLRKAPCAMRIPPGRRMQKNKMRVVFLSNFMYINNMNNQSNSVKEGNKLKLMAVFWDYTKFREEKYLRQFLKDKKGKSAYYWVMNRFLEYGRVVDTFSFFNIHEISKNLSKLKLSAHALKKWKRMIEVYG